MDVNATTATHPRRPEPGAFDSRRVGEILGQWQQREVRVLRAFPECRGLSSEQLEDLYQETVIALLARPYTSEAHLRSALRQGIRHRALNLHRDTRRHGRILATNAPGMQRAAEATAATDSPESVAFRDADRETILEFLGELTPFEQKVFELTADGLRYRAIATRLEIEVSEARKAVRRVERKRVEFRFRHDLGWQPHQRARASEQLVAPLTIIAAALSSARRWLLGTGVSGKAGVASAVLAMFAAGTVGIFQPRPMHPSARPTATGPRRGTATAARETQSGRGIGPPLRKRPPQEARVPVASRATSARRVARIAHTSKEAADGDAALAANGNPVKAEKEFGIEP